MQLHLDKMFYVMYCNETRGDEANAVSCFRNISQALELKGLFHSGNV